MSYFRPAVDAMTGYTPGEQPPPGSPIIKLNTNENPYPPSPKAIEVLRSLDSEWLRRYPDPYAREFCQAVSQALGVPAEWVVVTNGSDELLNLLVRACAEGCDRKVVYPTPTYVLYPTLAAMQSAQVVEIPYSEGMQLPLEELIAAQGSLTLIASPNSPSGHLVPLTDLRELARQVSGVLAIDEAYTDFAEYSALPLVEEFENVIVLRTLSKGYSLAGLRLGFGIAQPALLAGIFKLKDSYNIDVIATALGTAAMQDQPYKTAYAEKVKASRTKLQVDLKQLGFTVPESQGNFLLVTPPDKNAEDLYHALKARGILVRYFKQPGLDDKLRITVGTEAQNQMLLEALTSIQNKEQGRRIPL
ncbi:histidinol-phosphate transaminase [Pseudanabaena sp. FACHB-2040]|uniref:histidinol-phosphate transaminase n=1 Tax=Pseudanabaena sp. FACHB-2040 TaxID=2692859 RepID=UPI0016897130|nr:histidinol-phosphate transaminase [Pseudanabaena sp. FACHB-2040]MBD2258391.1 histidinol-phosphate transaminase [Pseudanabaena sp. FACHB-2040]